MRVSRVFSQVRKVVSAVDQRSQCKEEEAEFTKSLEKHVVFTGLCISAIIFVVHIFGGLGVDLLQECARQDDPFNFSGGDPRTLTFAWLLCEIALFPISLILTVLWYRYPCAKIDWEIAYTSAFSIWLVSPSLRNTWTAATLFGKPPADVWIKDTELVEGAVALGVDAIITGLCLFIPIRICLKWIPPFLACLAFSVSTLGIGSPHPQNTRTTNSLVWALASCALWGAWRHEREFRQSFTAQRMVQRKKQELELQRVGASCILARLCDCLVQLGHDYSICEPAPRLAALLFSTQDLNGKKFCDLVASHDDRERFVRALKGGADMSSNGGMVHISLRDTHGREFVVYAYHARIFGQPDGACGYIIALVEAQEREAPSVPSPPEQSKSLCFKGNSSQHSGSSLSSGSEMPIPLVDGCPVEIAAWVDLASPNLNIVRCTAGFTVLGPLTVGMGLSDMIEDADDFTVWLCRMLKWKDMAQNCKQPFALQWRHPAETNVILSAKCEPDLGVQCEPEAALFLRIILSEAHSSSESHALQHLTDECPVEAAAWIDTGSADMTIIECTTSFSKLLSLVAGADLSQVVTDSEGLRQWMQRVVNTRMNLFGARPFRLRLRSAPHAKIVTTAKCMVDLESKDSHDDDDGMSSLHLMFGDVRCKTRVQGSAQHQRPAGFQLRTPIVL